MSTQNDKADFFVQRNAESDWCIWDSTKHLVCVFHGLQHEQKPKENANNFCKAINEHAALNVLAEAGELASMALQDLFEDLKSYGDQSRREQVIAISNAYKKAQSDLASLHSNQP